MSETQTQSDTERITAAAATARSLCQQKDPDLLFAASMLRGSRRGYTLILWALVDQLNQILYSSDDPDEEGGCCGGSGDATAADAAGKRNTVCKAVIDHIFTNQLTGKPELDGIYPTAQQLGVKREPFEQYCDGVTASLRLPRLATWNQFRKQTSQTAGILVQLSHEMICRELDRNATDETQSAQLAAWADGLRLCATLSQLGEICTGKRGEQRMPLPLDDLIAVKLTDKKLFEMAASADAADEAKLGALVEQQSQRAANLLLGGMKAWRNMPTDVSRAATILTKGCLKRLDRAKQSPLLILKPVAEQPTPNRLTQFFGAMRISM